MNIRCYEVNNNSTLNEIVNKCIHRENETLEDFELRKIFKIPIALLTNDQKKIRNDALAKEKYKLEKHQRYHDMQHEISNIHWRNDEEIFL